MKKKVLELVELVDRGNTVENIKSVFCSELIALMLQNLGYLSNKMLADNYTPGDFSSENPHLNLIDVSLDKEIELKNPSRSWKDLCQIM